jgi:hypothetical protein
VVARITVALLAVTIAAVSSTAFATTGPAGAAGSPSAQGQPSSAYSLHRLAVAEKHFNCANAQRVVTYTQRRRAAFAKALAGANAKLAKAQAVTRPKLHSYLVTYWRGVIAKQQKHQSHALGPRMVARLAMMSTIAEAKCHVAAPTPGP